MLKEIIKRIVETFEKKVEAPKQMTYRDLRYVESESERKRREKRYKEIARNKAINRMNLGILKSNEEKAQDFIKRCEEINMFIKEDYYEHLGKKIRL